MLCWQHHCTWGAACTQTEVGLSQWPGTLLESSNAFGCPDGIATSWGGLRNKSQCWPAGACSATKSMRFSDGEPSQEQCSLGSPCSAFPLQPAGGLAHPLACRRPRL